MNFINKVIKFFKKPPLLMLICVLDKLPLMPVRLIALNSYSLLNKPTANAFSTVRAATIEDMKSIDLSEFKQNLFLDRFKSKEICLLAIVDNVVAGYEWFSINGSHTEERYTIPLDIPADSIYAYDAYVFPEFRRKGILKNLISHSFSLMSEYSKSEIFSYVDFGNSISDNAHIRLGFKKEGLTLYVKVRGINYIYTKEFNVNN